ncbi:MAG TPA: hypothetical protein VH084_21975 [Mycobacterium sp.]|jgi:hypothetical protein|nr:hypothetical protein [Mycobacterium sp.]
MIPKTGDMFGDAENPLEIAERFESYKASLTKSAQNPLPTPGVPTLDGQASNPMLDLQKSLGSDIVQKALSAELLESVRNSLATANVGKDTHDLLVGSGGALGGTGGLNAYDLEAPAKLLAPRPTPLRNRIARRKGIGTAHQYKRITGFTGTGTGGLSLMRPGITESSTTPFGSINYLRGPKISYAGDQASVPYMQFGVSDQVSWAAQFSGQGYQDIRQLSQTSVLYSSMLLEERMLLGGRGTGSGFSGALAAPTGVAAPIAVVGTTGYTAISGYTTSIYVRVTAESVWGESVASSPVTVTGAATSYVSVTATLPAGATGMKVYLGTGASDPGLPGSFFAGRTSGGAFIVQGALPTTGSIPSASDSSGSALDYDGILTYCTGSSSGYVKNISAVPNQPTNGINGGLNIANPGAEFFSAFAALYDSVKADPDEVLANGNDRKQLSDLLKTSSSSNYQISLINAPGTEGVHDARLGSLVTGLQNEVTGKMVNVTVHPWLPQGNMPIISWTLPLPDSNISDVFAVYNVQDYMAIEWPVTQFAYETSSYWYGTMVCYAPAWQGAITGITKV